MSLANRFTLLFAFASFLYSCANQKILHPSPKIGFDINALDKEGLIGPPDGKVAVNYEFCVPANNQYLNQVKQIDPSLQFHKKSKGRIACSKAEWLCIGSTHQEYAKNKLQRLAELEFVKRIERTYFE